MLASILLSVLAGAVALMGLGFGVRSLKKHILGSGSWNDETGDNEGNRRRWNWAHSSESWHRDI